MKQRVVVWHEQIDCEMSENRKAIVSRFGGMESSPMGIGLNSSESTQDLIHKTARMITDAIGQPV